MRRAPNMRSQRDVQPERSERSVGTAKAPDMAGADFVARVAAFISSKWKVIISDRLFEFIVIDRWF